MERAKPHTRDGFEAITCSKWLISKDIPVSIIAPHNDFLSENSNTLQLRNILKLFENSHELDEQKVIEVTNYLAAIFSERLPQMILTTAKGENGGIYYPSVQAGGMGYVAALSPDYADANLKLAAIFL